MQVTFSGDILYRQQFGGVSRYAIELACALKRLGLADVRLNAFVYVNQYLRRNATELAHRGLFMPYRIRGFGPLANLIQQLINKVHFKESDLLHVCYYGHDLLKVCKSPSVATFYDMIHERYMPDAKFSRQKRSTYDQVDHCIAISHATKRDMVERMGADPDRISVVYLAGNIVPRLPTEAELARQRRGLLWVGKRSGYKNFVSFARAFAKTRAYKDGIDICCAGGPSVTSTERELWLTFGLQPERVIHVIPNDDELETLYRTSLALVYVSKYEGFGLPPLEAMACGCPVIASNGGSIPEVVGEAGIVCEPEDVEAITDAIDRVVFDESLSRDLVIRGYQQASKFSWERCARETYGVYQTLIR